MFGEVLNFLENFTPLPCKCVRENVYACVCVCVYYVFMLRPWGQAVETKKIIFCPFQSLMCLVLPKQSTENIAP